MGTLAGRAELTSALAKEMFTPLGITPNQLRVDRIFDEAHHTADPVHLMRVFGIGKTTAIRYVRTAHPDLFAIDPTTA